MNAAMQKRRPATGAGVDIALPVHNWSITSFFSSFTALRNQSVRRADNDSRLRQEPSRSGQVDMKVTELS